MASITLSYLTLFPLPLSSIPTQTDDPEGYAAFTTAIRAEAALILSSPLWSSPKQWSDGLVETRSLPLGTTIHVPGVLHGAAPVEAGVSAESKKGGGGFWGGGGDKKKKEEEVDRGIAWHMRTSKLGEEFATVTSSLATYDVFWETLGERHTEQEAEYVSTLATIVKLEKDCFLKLYNLPFPTTNRSFLTHVVVITTTPPPTETTPNPLRSFLVCSLPVNDSTPIKEEKGHVRGQLVAVEEVKEVEAANGGSVELEWRCVSQSTPGGSIPTRLAESHMGSSMAASVPLFFKWLKEKHGERKPRKAPGHHKSLSFDGVRRSLSKSRRGSKDLAVDVERDGVVAA